MCHHFHRIGTFVQPFRKIERQMHINRQSIAMFSPNYFIFCIQWTERIFPLFSYFFKFWYLFSTHEKISNKNVSLLLFASAFDTLLSHEIVYNNKSWVFLPVQKKKMIITFYIKTKQNQHLLFHLMDKLHRGISIDNNQ